MVSLVYLSHKLPFKMSQRFFLTNLSPVCVNMVLCTVKPKEGTCSKQEQSASCHPRWCMSQRGGESRCQRPPPRHPAKRGLRAALWVITAIRRKPDKLLPIPFLFVLHVIFQALSGPPPGHPHAEAVAQQEITGEAGKHRPELTSSF